MRVHETASHIIRNIVFISVQIYHMHFSRTTLFSQYTITEHNVCASAVTVNLFSSARSQSSNKTSIKIVSSRTINANYMWLKIWSDLFRKTHIKNAIFSTKMSKHIYRGHCKDLFGSDTIDNCGETHNLTQSNLAFRDS